MFDINRPLHAYDADKIEKGIIVRNSKFGEEFTALDNKSYKLQNGMCVISDNKGVLGLGGIIGGALDAWMLHPNFQMNKDDPKKMGIGLEKLVDHFDHICQLSGNCKHIGFGSDLDGLFGLEQTPIS